MTRIAYFDCPAGASGDMIMGAFLDAGLPMEHLREQLSLLDFHGYEVESELISKQGLAAVKFHVNYEHQHHHRTYADIRDMIDGSKLSGQVKETAKTVFRNLAVVEGKMHGRKMDEVHFHEVGAVDSIVDMVGAAIALEWFEISEITASPLPLGSGFVECAHGRIPLPAPATLELLKDVPTYGTELKTELVTPTGAVLLSTLAASFGPRPYMTIKVNGRGAGTRDLPDRPNILRLSIGEPEGGTVKESLYVAETNIDDMNPELLPFLMEKLMAAGALDVWLTPIQMKKGRPAVTLSVLSGLEDTNSLTELVLRESTTLGVRTYRVDRIRLPREESRLETPWGEITVKKVLRNGKFEIIPEFEACRAVAEQTNLPLREIYDAVKRLGDDKN